MGWSGSCGPATLTSPACGHDAPVRTWRGAWPAPSACCCSCNEIAALSVLLQLQPCRVSAELFRDWWSRYRAAEGDDLEGLDEYEEAYRRCLWRALNYGLLRFSGEPKPPPLTLDEPTMN
jgi:hypothetical protein